MNVYETENIIDVNRRVIKEKLDIVEKVSFLHYKFTNKDNETYTKFACSKNWLSLVKI